MADQQKKQYTLADSWIRNHFEPAWKKGRKRHQNLHQLAAKLAVTLGAKKLGSATIAGQSCILYQTPNGGSAYLNGCVFLPVPLS